MWTSSALACASPRRSPSAMRPRSPCPASAKLRAPPTRRSRGCCTRTPSAGSSHRARSKTWCTAPISRRTGLWRWNTSSTSSRAREPRRWCLADGAWLSAAIGGQLWLQTRQLLLEESRCPSPPPTGLLIEMHQTVTSPARLFMMAAAAKRQAILRSPRPRRCTLSMRAPSTAGCGLVGDFACRRGTRPLRADSGRLGHLNVRPGDRMR
mmetsp:Transcript_6892/g.20379  ORF Transcript_6892/g.20379 Transcript_6892/m.20379 type:complete len:209 (+) Transcript_6892:858-1484(+)